MSVSKGKLESVRVVDDLLGSQSMAQLSPSVDRLLSSAARP